MINFDFPNCSEDYVHRIGRTARSDRTGTSYTFFTANNCKQAKDLLAVLREAKQQVNPKLLALAEQAKGIFGRSKYSKLVNLRINLVVMGKFKFGYWTTALVGALFVNISSKYERSGNF